MKNKYRVINKSDNLIRSFTKAHDVATFFLGGRVANYLVIKSEGDSSDKLVLLVGFDVGLIEQQLEDA